MTVEGLSPESNDALVKKEQPGQIDPSVVNQEMANKLTYIRQQAPWLSPSTMLSLAKANASPEAIALAGYMQGMKATEDPPPGQESEVPGWLSKTAGVVIRMGSSAYNIAKKPLGMVVPDIAQPAFDLAGQGLNALIHHPGVRATSRWTIGAVQAVPEALQYMGSRAAREIGADIVLESDYAGGFYDVLTITHMIRDFKNQGDGYLPSNYAILARQRAERAHRGMLNGQVFTIGRGVANIVSPPDTESYKTISGLIDGIITVKAFDPTRYIKPVLRGARSAVGVVPMVKRTYTPDEVRSFLQQQAGLAVGPAGPTVDLEKFVKFMKTHPLMKVKVRKLIKDTDEASIFFNHFNGQVNTETAVALAAAKTEDEVIAALVPAYTMGPGVLAPRHVTTLTTFGNIGMGRVMRRSRLLTQLEDEFMVITGDPEDNRKAVLSAVALMRTSGVGHKDVMEVARGWIKALQKNASRVDIHKMDEMQKDLITRTLRANGHSQLAADTIWAKTKSQIDDIRSYFKNRMGVDTDGGFLNVLMNEPGIQSILGTKFYNEIMHKLSAAGGGVGDTIAFDGAVQLMDLMNRTIFLPNFRELRRVTRNPLFRKALGDLKDTKSLKTKILKKRAITSHKKRVEAKPEKYQPQKWDQLNDAIKNIEDDIAMLKKSGSPAALAQLPAKNALLKKLADEKVSMLKTERVMLGEQRLPFMAIDFIQNRLWKTMVLLTGGYMMRNTIEAQLRMQLAGVGKVSYLRPRALDYIALAIGRSNKTDILGDSILARGWSSNPQAEINTMVGELGDRFRGGARRMGMPESFFGTHRAKLGVWTVVSRGNAKNGTELHADGILQQIERLATRAANQEYARMIVRGMGPGLATGALVDWLFAPGTHPLAEAFTHEFGEVKKIFNGGLEFVNTRTGERFKLPPIDLDKLPEVEAKKLVSIYVDKVMKGGFETHTGNVDTLQFLVAYGDIPALNGFGTLDVQPLSISDVWEFPNKTGDLKVLPLGHLVYDNHNTPYRVIFLNRGGKSGELVRVQTPNALKTTDGRREIKNIIKKAPLYDEATGQGLPQSVSRELTGSPWEASDEFHGLKESMDRVARWWFGILNERPTRELERSPTFRYYYYETVMEHADDLSDQTVALVLSNLEKKAAEVGVDVEKFVGNKQFIQKLQDLRNVKTKRVGAIVDAKQLDEYAKAVALKKMEELLFDASKTNNLTDILRVVTPFGNAWNNIVGHWLKASMTDGIHMYRAAQRTITGLQAADPDNDGRGWMYNDPATGELMMTLPFSGSASQLITGDQYSAPLTFPVKRLSQGINVLPAIGPVAQVAVAQFPVTPSNRDIVEFLLPYGPPRDSGIGAAAPIPGWAIKIYEALEADTNKINTIFRNTYDETRRAEVTTGMYDLSQPEEMARLNEVSAKKASLLTGMRALSQFFGPTSGSTDFKVPTNAGDQYAKVLIQEFQDMQREDYDTAVLRFLSLYGENAMMYLASKSEALAAGLEATRDFGDWEQQNEALIDEYPRIANYFGPSFGDFDFMTLNRQLEVGDRRPLSDEEQVHLAHLRIGSARYRAVKLRLGSDLSKEEKDKLANYRVYLSIKYPGFPPRAEFVTNQYLNDMEELKRIVRDPRLQSNAALPSVIMYLKRRQELLNSADAKTFESKKMGSSREELFIFGSRIAERDIHFRRIWQRFLAEEVEN